MSMSVNILTCSLSFWSLFSIWLIIRLILFCTFYIDSKITHECLELELTGETGLTLVSWSTLQCGALDECVHALHVLYLVLLRCGEPGLDEESSLLAVSIREALLCSCFPADDSGLFTAPKTLADFGFDEGGATGDKNGVRHVTELGLKTLQVWLILPFLVWRMTSSLVGENFLCCWNSETEWSQK